MASPSASRPAYPRYLPTCCNAQVGRAGPKAVMRLGGVVLVWSAARRRLGQRQQIAIRVLEPSDFRTAWRRPNAKLVLLHKGIALEHHTFSAERPHDLFKRNHRPAELCVRLWCQGLHLLNAQFHAVRVEDNGELILRCGR